MGNLDDNENGCKSINLDKNYKKLDKNISLDDNESGCKKLDDNENGCNCNENNCKNISLDNKKLDAILDNGSNNNSNINNNSSVAGNTAGRSKLYKKIKERINIIEKGVIPYISEQKIKQIKDEINYLFFEMRNSERESGIKKPTEIKIDD